MNTIYDYINSKLVLVIPIAPKDFVEIKADDGVSVGVAGEDYCLPNQSMVHAEIRNGTETDEDGEIINKAEVVYYCRNNDAVSDSKKFYRLVGDELLKFHGFNAGETLSKYEDQILYDCSDTSEERETQIGGYCIKPVAICKTNSGTKVRIKSGFLLNEDKVLQTNTYDSADVDDDETPKVPNFVGDDDEDTTPQKANVACMNINNHILKLNTVIGLSSVTNIKKCNDDLTIPNSFSLNDCVSTTIKPKDKLSGVYPVAIYRRIE